MAGMNPQMQRTLVVLKPDSVQRQLVGRIISRLEDKGLIIAGLKMVQLSQAVARRMYQPHKGKDFYEPLVEFITAGPVVVMVLQGMGVIDVVRKQIGSTFGPDALGGTIRGDFGMSKRYNLIHASDSVASAKREISIFFRAGELVDYRLNDERWIYALAPKGKKLL